MKKQFIISFALACALFTPSASTFAQAFEGTVNWTLLVPQMGTDKHEMTINLKGNKAESEIDLGPQGEVKTFVDRDAKKLWVVMESMHMGMTGDIPNDSAANALASKEVLDIKPTGQKANIAGHKAEEYTVKTPDADMSLWAASDFPKEIREAMHHSMASQPGQKGAQARVFQVLSEKGLFPVKVVMHGGPADGTTMEFVKYEQKNLDDSIFTPPADIQFQPMPKMGGKM